MEKRVLGKTGEQLSILGFGGILVDALPQAEADRMVAESIERGVNYFDVAPSYGEAEAILGPALVGRREKIFLACKTMERTREGARRELESSLQRLKTDHFDLYQLHAMATRADFEAATGPGGALETLVEARRQGLIRHIGFSAHNADVALKLLDTFPFDSVLFPANWVNFFNGNFGPQILARAAELGIGRLALKAMARTTWGGREKRYKKTWYEPEESEELAELALRFTLSQPITAAVPPGEPKFFPRALAYAERFHPITPEETERLRQAAAGLEPIFR
ncbi:MAG: aldo/keto reductase [Firmicutes bacterium]|nr:aldo/keto reductase [Bacillota bacterium]